MEELSFSELINSPPFDLTSLHYNASDDGKNHIFLYKNSGRGLFDEMSKTLKSRFSDGFFSKTDGFTAVYYPTENVLYGLTFDEKANEIRLIADNNTRLPRISPIKTQGSAPVKLWQYEIDHSLIDCGMCYIIRLPDYSFIVIDTPHYYSVNDDVRICDFLRKNTPDGLPVRVAAWIFTHGHDDHIGKIAPILTYETDIVIEGIYYNFPGEDYLENTGRGEAGKQSARSFYSVLALHPEIPVYTLHSGQKIYFNGLTVDVLCTQEDVFPASFDNYNDSSAVLMITAGDDKVLFPGDAGALESEILERRFPDYLKCDIVQAAHHGHFGCTPEFYRLCGADTVLFPVTKIMFDGDYPRYEATRVADMTAKHSFIASDGTVEFTFPLKGSKIILYPDEIFENFEGIFNLWTYTYTDEYKTALRERFNAQRGAEIQY